MGYIAYRIGVGYRSVWPGFGRRCAAAGHADPVTLPAMASTGSGPIIGGGGAAAANVAATQELG